MKLDASKFGLAAAIVFAVAWVICSVLVVAFPAATMQLGGHMLHVDLAGSGWSMHWMGFVIGLVLWTVLAGVFGWAIAAIYNRLIA